MNWNEGQKSANWAPLGERRPESPAKYAKLSLPRMHEALLRPRVFAVLDQLRQSHEVIWMHSPPGAGKTVLAASYLATAIPPPIWYQIDNVDTDPATFFYFLGQSLLPDSGPALPWLAPELVSDVPCFARLFFRDFYSRLPEGTFVVFDNVQDFDWDNSGELLEIAFGEVPKGINVLVLSRDSPPVRLARLELSGQLATLDWNVVRFDREESKALAQFGEAIDPANLAWLDQVDGWAAGVVMLREHLARHSKDPVIPLLEGRGAIFRYFAGEILERMSVDEQKQLLMLSCLPGISATDAEKLTGDSGAARLLSGLYHNRLFLERRDASSKTYHFHALFREFLQHEAQRRLEPDARSALIEQAARILDKQGRIEEAAALYRNAGAYSALADLLLRSANNMMATGRGQTWREWLGWLPQDIVEALPWLWYWQGAFLIHIDPQLVEKTLSRAERAFRSAGDVRAQLLTIAAIVDCYYYHYGSADFRNLKPWADAMIAGLSSLDPNTFNPGDDLYVHSRLTLALVFTTPESPLLRQVIDRAVQSLPLADTPAEKIAAGGALLLCMHWIDPGVARWLISEFGEEANDSSISPSMRAWWYLQTARWYFYLDGDIQAAKKFIDSALVLAKDFGLKQMATHLAFTKTRILLGENDLVGAKALLEPLRPMLSPVIQPSLFRFAMVEALYLLQTGDTKEALRIANEAFERGVEAGFAVAERSRYERILAGCHAQADDFKAANLWSARAIEHAHGVDIQSAEEAGRFISVYTCLRQSGERLRAITLLRETLSSHRQRKSHAFFVRFPKLAAELAAFALNEGIEINHVRCIIKRQCLTPPDRLTSNWPWPVAVRTLGKLEISLWGDVLAPGGKAQQRPLMLLKALLASPGGKSQQALATQLWPDVDGPVAALNVAIHRLRKMLNNDDAVVVAGGKIAIDTTIVWSDVVAMTEICDQVDSLSTDTDQVEITRLAADLVDLYKGPFCDGDDDSWLLSTARDRWRIRFLVAAEKLGTRLEALCQWQVANDLYIRAIDVEPLAETIYRGLMRCAHARSDALAAFSAYRRCKDIVSLVLARKPSEETEKLAAYLGLPEPNSIR
jgi:DNA-binding SARP family transcriptional activator/tetratricopeptide (TPR) repeat protein